MPIKSAHKWWRVHNLNLHIELGAVVQRVEDTLCAAAPLNTVSLSLPLCSPRFYAIMLICRACLPPIHYRLELRDCFLYFPSLQGHSWFFGRPAFIPQQRSDGETQHHRALTSDRDFVHEAFMFAAHVSHSLSFNTADRKWVSNLSPGCIYNNNPGLFLYWIVSKCTSIRHN